MFCILIVFYSIVPKFLVTHLFGLLGSVVDIVVVVVTLLLAVYPIIFNLSQYKTKVWSVQLELSC